MKALVWFWLIDETLSANLVYQSNYEIGSTTPSDEANEDHDMMMMMMMMDGDDHMLGLGKEERKTKSSRQR